MRSNVKKKKCGGSVDFAGHTHVVKRKSSGRVGMKRAGSYYPPPQQQVDPRYTAAQAQIKIYKEEQEANLLNRFMMRPELSKWQKVQCKLGLHGGGKVRRDDWIASDNGKITTYNNMSRSCFCSYCGHNWMDDSR